jgi:hypothetical protein
MDAIFTLLKEVGAYNAMAALCLLLCILSQLREWKRTDRLERKVEELEEERVKTIIPLLTECKDALKITNQTVERNSRVMEAMLKEKLL